jgi:hypothetical protein
MAEDAWSGPGPQTTADEEPVGDSPRPTLGVILAAALAIAASAGLAWWVASPNSTATNAAVDVGAAPQPAPVAPRPAPQPLRYAAADPDPNQVRQALVDVQKAYAEDGADGLLQASAACAKALPADPRRLDYCLAYDAYAAMIVPPGSGPQADWFADGGERDLALARTALPGSANAANRIAQVAALTRAVVPRPPKKPVAVRAKQVRKVAPARPKLVKAHALKPKAARSKVVKARARGPWYPPWPSTLDGQYAREAAAEAELDRMISQGLVDPPH